MKKLLKLPLLLITLLLIFSCGRNIEGDVNTVEDAIERLNTLYQKEDAKENLLKEELEIYLEIEGIFSYYVNDANSDETLSFINSLSELDRFELYRRKDLEEELYGLRYDIERTKKSID